jgi:hypothetical protein
MHGAIGSIRACGPKWPRRNFRVELCFGEKS